MEHNLMGSTIVGQNFSDNFKHMIIMRVLYLINDGFMNDHILQVVAQMLSQ